MVGHSHTGHLTIQINTHHHCDRTAEALSLNFHAVTNLLIIFVKTTLNTQRTGDAIGRFGAEAASGIT